MKERGRDKTGNSILPEGGAGKTGKIKKNQRNILFVSGQDKPFHGACSFLSVWNVCFGFPGEGGSGLPVLHVRIPCIRIRFPVF